MKPHEPQSLAKSAARVRMFLRAHLGWLGGFPLGSARGGQVQWLALESPGAVPEEPILVGREHLHTATLTVAWLRRDFPRALPRVVGDPDRWAARIHALLEPLQAAVHAESPLPSNPLALHRAFPAATLRTAARLARAHPALQPLLDALAWSLFLSPETLAEALGWLEAHAADLVTLLEAQGPDAGRLAAVRLWRLARDEGQARLAPLLRRLGDPRVHRVPASGGAAYLKQLKDAPANPPPPLPDPSTAGMLLDWAAWLLGQPSSTRRRSLQLFEATDSPLLLEHWEAWWRQVEALRPVLRKLRAGRLRAKEAEDLLAELKSRIRQLEEAEPVPLLKELLVEPLEALAAPGLRRLQAEACRTLPLLPEETEGIPTRLGFLAHWAGLAASEDDDAPGAAWRAVACFGDYLRRAAAPGAGQLLPWKRVLARVCRDPSAQRQRRDVPLERRLARTLPDRKLWPAYYEALRLACAAAPAGIDEYEAQCLILLIKADPEPARAARRLGSVMAAGLRSEVSWHIETVLALQPETDRHFTDLVKQLEAVTGDLSNRRNEAFTAGLQRLCKSGDVDLVRGLVLEGQVRPLVGLGLRLSFLERVSGAPLAPPQPLRAAEGAAAWTERYPQTLRPALQDLCAADPDAQATAGRILGSIFPDPGALRQELAILEQREAEGSARIARRIQNLRARLGSVPTLSPARAEKAALKLRRAASRSRLQAWETHCAARVREAVLRDLEIPEAPDWLFEDRALEPLLNTAGLEPARRRLALRVFRARLEPPPWDLRDAPENQVFLDGLRRRGIDPAPWVEGIGRVEGAGPLFLALEDDPLEIAFMGEHFGTCLSLGSFNYFSVFANAADINKRVVYARDAQGAVQGRCLLGLTAEGGLVTFHAYAHDAQKGFVEQVRSFVQRLAGAMRTVLLPGGRIPTLVARDWYDDGPRDLTGAFTFLEEGSAFRKELPGLEPEAAVERLRELFDPLPLNELTLPLFLDLFEVRQNPKLILPLLPLLEELGLVPEHLLLPLAARLAKDGEGALARRLLQGRPARAFRGLGTYDIGLLLEVDPSLALQALRRTRARGVRAWAEEADPERVRLAAQAHERLGRKKLAAQIAATALARTQLGG